MLMMTSDIWRCLWQCYDDDDDDYGDGDKIDNDYDDDYGDDDKIDNHNYNDDENWQLAMLR